MGLVAMISEFAIGLATLTGFMLVYAALGGLIMSLTLWLTLSWAVSPYFLGSDSAYLIMWAVLLGSIFKKSGRLRLPDFSERREVLTLALLGGLSIIGVIAGKNFKREPQKLSSAGSSNAIAKVSDIAIGTSINIVDTFGAPAIIFRTKSGVYAYSAVCTHQGCTVEFDKNSKHLICPCHGAEFDPANSAKVLAGPTSTPLPKVKILVKGDEIFLI
jgi:thiosulfate dehydrogenase [quinone] large subunit